jgi:uncharacterized HAD superfamily protein
MKTHCPKFFEKEVKKMGIICVDVDDTLTHETCWTVEQCENATPRQDVIDRVNEVSITNFIVIYTARRDFLIPATLKWLRKHGVVFHAFSNNKCPTDIGYLDDKAITIKDFLKGGKL